MYEAEVNYGKQKITSLPPEIRQKFKEFRARVIARTTLPWGEHCTECVWPSCYTTCSLYERRSDGACRQFVGSAVRLDNDEGLSPYVLRIQFKRWAKFWTIGNTDLKSLISAEKEEKVNISLGAFARNLPLPFATKSKILGKINYLRRNAAENVHKMSDSPDSFLFECYNPDQNSVSFTFTARPRERSVVAWYEKSITVDSGYTRARIPFSEITSIIDLAQPFELEIVPNGVNEGATLYFGLMDFVRELPSPHTESVNIQLANTKPTKCVVWDLDNTLWDGTLIETGLSGIKLKGVVVDAIKEIDRRGILQSIASKNNREDALEALRHFGIDDYFLYPQINWDPKSKSVFQIAQNLNIGLESLIFIDDQAFEREEVHSSLGLVTVLDAADFATLLNLPGCRLPITDESRRRRQMYREQEVRKEALEASNGNYLEFLRSCQMMIYIDSLNASNLERVYELAQRTNQLNFSGNRYHLTQLQEMAGICGIRPMVISCRDRFGDYGIVGFAVIDVGSKVLLDLMFSCRVQGKRVEHAVLSFVLHEYVAKGGASFYAQYRQNSKNANSGKVFQEIGFESVKEEGGVSLLIFRHGKDIPDDKALSVRVRPASEPHNGEMS